MTNEIQVIDHTQPAQIAVAGQFNPSREQIDLLKRTIAKDTTDDEFALFVNTAKRMGLDPFARQIYALKRKTKSGDVMTIQVGIDGLRAIADRTGQYAPGPATEYEHDEKQNIVSATAFACKLVAGEWRTFSHKVYFREYAQQYGLWADKPHVMIGKCAEAGALRKGFPSQLSGVYTDDEMPPPDADEPPKATKAIAAKKQPASDAPPPVEKAIAAAEKAIELSQLDSIREKAAGYYGVGSEDYARVESAIGARTHYLMRDRGNT